MFKYFSLNRCSIKSTLHYKEKWPILFILNSFLVKIHKTEFSSYFQLVGKKIRKQHGRLRNNAKEMELKILLGAPGRFSQLNAFISASQHAGIMPSGRLPTQPVICFSLSLGFPLVQALSLYLSL